MQRCELASMIASDLYLRRDALRLTATFADSVQVIRITPAIIDRLSYRMNRLTAAYEAAIELI